MRTGAPIVLTEEDDWWVATDEETGITSQGRTREAALENLDEAHDGFHGAGETPIDEQLREAGIDPERNVSGDLDDSEIFEQWARDAPDVRGLRGRERDGEQWHLRVGPDAWRPRHPPMGATGWPRRRRPNRPGFPPR